MTLVGRVSDRRAARGSTRICRALVAASYEDFGLTPLEAAGFGKPTAALRLGGFLDTHRRGETGVFFDEPTAAAITQGCERRSCLVLGRAGDPSCSRPLFESRFVERLRALAVPR